MTIQIHKDHLIGLTDSLESQLCQLCTNAAFYLTFRVKAVGLCLDHSNNWWLNRI